MVIYLGLKINSNYLDSTNINVAYCFNFWARISVSVCRFPQFRVGNKMTIFNNKTRFDIRFVWKKCVGSVFEKNFLRNSR